LVKNPLFVHGAFYLITDDFAKGLAFFFATIGELVDLLPCLIFFKFSPPAQINRDLLRFFAGHSEQPDTAQRLLSRFVFI